MVTKRTLCLVMVASWPLASCGGSEETVGGPSVVGVDATTDAGTLPTDGGQDGAVDPGDSPVAGHDAAGQKGDGEATDAGADAPPPGDTVKTADVAQGPDAEPDAGQDVGPDDAHDAAQDAGQDVEMDAGMDAGDDAGMDAGTDAGMDAEQDAEQDAGMDAGQDAGMDAGQDAGMDAGQDAGQDAGMDAGQDVAQDTGPQPGCTSDKECATQVLLAACLVAKCAGGKCAVGLAPDGEACDDGDKCTGQDACKAGKCLGGKPKSCDDANACTDDACDKAKGCVHTGNAATCSDASSCKTGQCKGGKCVLSDKAGCDDGDPCTTDQCTKAKGCVFSPAADGGKCDDGDLCTEGDACKGGKCAGPTPTDCDDGNACTDDACDPGKGCSWSGNTAACEDGDKCTKGDKCSSGKCLPGAKLDPKVACKDGNPCTADGCDAAKGCVHPPASGPCDDGSKCTVKDACDKTGKCLGTTQGVCPDGGPCKTTSCNPKTGACSWGAKKGPCDDGDACTAGDACKNGKCLPGDAVDCDDKNACTVDKCDVKTGKCGHAQSAAPCDDGQACTTGDACVGAKCQGVAVVCNDGDPCTKDACDPKTGKCQHVKEAGCQGCAVQADCEDGDPCTTDTCDAFTGKCSAVFNKGPCDNGDPCTWGDKCDGKGKCVTGKAPTCDDDNDCTADKCDKATGECTHAAAADGTQCSDGKACTGAETCKGGQCVPGVDKCDIYFEPFDCPWNNAAKGWTLQSGSGSDPVRWAIDNTPNIAMAGKGCNLNYNDGVDYCQPWYGKYCRTPSHYAATPPIDASKASGTPRLRFWAWYDVDPGSTDRPLVRIYSGNKLLHSFTLDKTKMKTWRAMDVAVPNVKGKKNVRVYFRLYAASGAGGNKGKGWFIDDLRLSNGGPPPELCTDGIDNDLDGKVDCTDADCMDTAACLEQCDDGVDNDLDDKIDCADPDCAGENNCKCLLIDCDDKDVCTTDACDPKTAKCTHVNNQAPCDDGMACTTGDTCGDGNCVGTPKACGDGDPCTTDACDPKTGKCGSTKIPGCGGCQSDAGCDDGNACTTDKCDPKTGKCEATPNKAPCDAGEPCTWGDKCDGKGKCVVGKNPSCDDGEPCTKDLCDPKTGKCGTAPLEDGSKCSDGKACTTGETCKAGVCTPKKADCPLYAESFDCPWPADDKGWKLDSQSGSNPLKWAVDETPKVTLPGKGCNLNYNDGVDYCQPWYGKYCRKPGNSAWSPVIDASAVTGTPRLRFSTWYDLDPGNNTDLPRIYIYSGGVTLHAFALDKGKMKQWRKMDLAVPAIKGRKDVRLRFILNPSSGAGGNKGKGWFIDDLVITNPGSAAVPPEVCDDGVDNDFDTRIDCLDLDCKAAAVCQEQCDDGVDNDFDDKIDCLDPDCSADALCQPPLITQPMGCGDKGWTFSPPKNGVAFAIDKTPGSVTPYSGSCTMNFNNGKNFCGVPGCKDGDGNNRTAGTATLVQTIDATGLKALRVEYWSYLWGQAPKGPGVNYDIGLLQVSTDGFKGCCGGSSTCSSWSADYCNTPGTRSFLADKSAAAYKKWVKVKVDLKDMVGKKFKLRLRFTSRSQVQNDFPGWFVDDLKVFAGK